ncbi:MAG: O-antigen ligase family protein [Alphaproteobacteria bacterium]|nr:O-antigen ligase family protein [Alphaproteobacteria bacterium]
MKKETNIKKALGSLENWGTWLTILIPLALVVGRAPADVLVSATALLFFADSALHKKWGWVKKPWVVAALLLWLYTVVRAAFIPGMPGDALWAAFVWVRYIVFAASLADWTLAEEKGRTRLLQSLTAAVLFLSSDAIIQYITGYDVLGHTWWYETRLTGPYNRPILGMTIANLFAPVLFWLLQKKKFLLSFLVTTISFEAVFLSGDRMGFLFAAFIVAVWLFFLVRAKPAYGLSAFAALLGLGILLAQSPHLAERQFASTLETMKEKTESPYALVWRSALDVGMTNPLFGVGIKQFRVLCPEERFGPVTVPDTEYLRCYTHPHNAYMEWFSEEGVIGLLGFIGFGFVLFFSMGKSVLSHRTDLIFWGLGAMLAMRLMPLFITTGFFNNWVAIPFWLALGWAMSYSKPATKQPF